MTAAVFSIRLGFSFGILCIVCLVLTMPFACTRFEKWSLGAALIFGVLALLSIVAWLWTGL